MKQDRGLSPQSFNFANAFCTAIPKLNIKSMQQRILVIDFGSQYTQLIARRVRELEVFSEIVPWHRFTGISDDVKGLILSGSPASVRSDDAPKFDLGQLPASLPVLGICYGAQLMAHQLGGSVEASESREYGRARLVAAGGSKLLTQIDHESQVWMSHGDSILNAPTNAIITAKTADIPIAAFDFNDRNWFGLQFHPEVSHTHQGKKWLAHFLFDICGLEANWKPMHFVQNSIKEIREQAPVGNIVCGLSGGVDSSVAALLVHRAVGTDRLQCLLIDNGLMRWNEIEDVLKAYADSGLNIRAVNARERFLTALDGVSDPETKRKIIGRIFIEVFEAEARKLEDVRWLVQGTIYPDIIESSGVHGTASVIKSHHNVGGLPERMHLQLIEPLRQLFKDEVRKVGRELGLAAHLSGRHPFPGPGLAIRILGEITPERVRLLQQADAIFIEGLREWNLYDKVWQAFAVLLPVYSVGVMGDERTYEQVLALRAVESIDGMTADWAHLPYDFLSWVSNRIINRVQGINRVVYDISSKPPATIEWE